MRLRTATTASRTKTAEEARDGAVVAGTGRTKTMSQHAWVRMGSNSLGKPEKGYSAWRCPSCRRDAHVRGSFKPGRAGCVPVVQEPAPAATAEVGEEALDFGHALMR